MTTLITNHTFSGLVLRPPGLAAQGTTVDEPIYKALGDKMAAENGYASQYGYELYDTTGTTEDWSYNATGGLGYTFEIGDLGFHPQFSETVAEWNGTTDDATGGGNRAAYYLAQENTADAGKHSVLAGKAPAGAVLRLKKTFQTPTYDGSTFTDVLDTTIQVAPTASSTGTPTRRHARWSRRARAGGARQPERADPVRLARRHHALRELRHPAAGCYEDHLIKVPSGAGIDNAKATFRVEWPTPVSDYDMKVYKADAAGNATGDPVATLRQRRDRRGARLRGGVDPRSGRLLRRARDQLRGRRALDRQGQLRGTAAGPGTAAGDWTLFCEQPEGVIRSARQVYVGRGERRTLDLRTDCKSRR